MRWRGDFFQHSAYLTARVPRCTCGEHGVKQVQVPWARPGPGFTLLFEALMMMLVKAIEAYRMKLTLQDFYEQPNPKAARQFLSEWYEMVQESALEPMRKVAKTLRDHTEGILRWFTSGLANGLLEGINSLLQAAKSKARGYRTTRNLIAIAYLLAGKLTFALPLRPAKLPT